MKSREHPAAYAFYSNSLWSPRQALASGESTCSIDETLHNNAIGFKVND